MIYHDKYDISFRPKVIFCSSLFTALLISLWMMVPLAMTLLFVIFIIPSLDRYLATKYKAEFEEYSRKTKKLFPFIY